MAVCAGGAGLALEDRAELLAVLTKDPDEALAERAGSALLSVPLEAFVTAAARADAAPQLLQYCAEELRSKPGIADALAKNPSCPAMLLARVAKYFSTSAAQEVVGNIQRLSEAPELAEALVASPSVTVEQKSALQDMLREDGDEAAMRDAVADVEPDERKRETLLQRLAKMRVIDRIKLALTGGQSERLYLIRDPNKMVQRGVLQSPRLSDREVEAFASMGSISDEILRLIAGNRVFIKNYIVVKNLINNPKTPLNISLHLLPRLNPNDLKFLTMNKNVPETLRTTAAKLMRQRSQAKKGSE
jgi:hypothetical protein